jgi:hypothetical protein
MPPVVGAQAALPCRGIGLIGQIATACGDGTQAAAQRQQMKRGKQPLQHDDPGPPSFPTLAVAGWQAVAGIKGAAGSCVPMSVMWQEAGRFVRLQTK